LSEGRRQTAGFTWTRCLQQTSRVDRSSHRYGPHKTMKLDRKIFDRATLFKRRVIDLQSAFSLAHTQMTEFSTHRDLRHLEMHVGEFTQDAFEVTFAGTTMILRMVPEMTEVGVASGKLLFLAKTYHAFQDHQLVGFIRVKHNGKTDMFNEDGEPVDLAYCLLDGTLMMFEKLFRDRAV